MIVRSLVSASLLGFSAFLCKIPAAPDADRPPMVHETNGVYDFSWGSSGLEWPQKLFYEHVPMVNNHHLGEMRAIADSHEASGKIAMIGGVYWGWEYRSAIGGDPAQNLPDLSQTPGWKQYGEWLHARTHYFARTWDGEIWFPNAGYITPLMPLDEADWPEGIPNANFGDWLGVKLGNFALHTHNRGLMAADFVVGLYGAHIDFNHRVLDDFASWAGVNIPGETIRQRADVVVGTLWPEFSDYRSHKMANFYARMAKTIQAGGRVPVVGGQILPNPALARGWGSDFRIYLEHLPAENWLFQIELQSDWGRPVPEYWESSSAIGLLAGRDPDIPLGAHMNSNDDSFWFAADMAGISREWGVKSLKHQWLSVGWTHVATSEGGIRRAPLYYQRGYWDSGTVPDEWVDLIYAHIPRKPWGPAIYYSVAIERTFDVSGNDWYRIAWAIPTFREDQSLPSGYFASDWSLDHLQPHAYPTCWLVYEAQHLPALERAKLEAIAPVVGTTADALQYSPLRFEGDGIGGFGFIDQNDSKIILVSNASKQAVSGRMHLKGLPDGQHTLHGKLGTPTLEVVMASGVGSVDLNLPAGESWVFEIRQSLQIKPVGNQAVRAGQTLSIQIAAEPQDASTTFSASSSLP
jgi:hypothetical protein